MDIPPNSPRPVRSASDIRLIAISGKQYSGKDVLTRLLLARLPAFRQLPLARAIKQAYAEREGLSLAEVELHKAQHRPGLIALGDWGRKQDSDYWLKQVLNTPGCLIISDLRLQREYDMLKAAGAFLIRVNADRSVRATRGTLVSETDATECELDGITDWDALLTNNGSVKDLEKQVTWGLCKLFTPP